MKKLLVILFLLQRFFLNAQSWSSPDNGLDAPVSCLYADSSSNLLYAGGGFTNDGVNTMLCIAKWNGVNWSSVGSGLNSAVYSITGYNGDIYAGGQFDTIAGFGSTGNHIAKWDGTSWHPLGAGINGPVFSLCVFNGKLYAGGLFDTAGTIPAKNIACWDGTNWSSVGTGTDHIVQALHVYNNELYVGGDFTLAGGVSANSIARWNDTIWQTVGLGTNNGIWAMEVFNGELFVGGTMTLAGTTSVHGIARWNGTVWDSVAYGFGTAGSTDPVFALKAYNGYLYAGGEFMYLDWFYAYNIAKWDGSIWSTVGTYGFTASSTSWVNCIETYDGYVYMGGSLSDADTILPLNNIARWDDGILWPGDANHTALVDHTDLLPIGLYFGQTGPARSSISNSWQAYTATDWGIQQLNGADIKHADCNGDGTINLSDTLAVNLNFNQIHYMPVLENENTAVRSLPVMYFTLTGSSYSAGDWVNAELRVGTASNPVLDLYGLAFSINYNNVIQPGTESLTYTSSWFGTPGSDVIKISKMDNTNDRALGAITRIDQLPVSGYGKIADFKFQLKSSFSASDSIYLLIDAYKANDETGQPQLLNSIPFVMGTPTGIMTETYLDDFYIYPNPATHKLTVETTTQNGFIVLVDITGHVLKQTAINAGRTEIDVRDLPNGVYFVRCNSAVKKFIVNR